MAGKPTTPYHIDQQYADSLLRPISVTLAELEERLTHYVERLHLEASDRARVEAARDTIAEARRRLKPISEPADPAVWRRTAT